MANIHIHTFFPSPALSAHAHPALEGVGRRNGEGEVAAQPQVAGGRVRRDGAPAVQRRKEGKRERGAQLYAPEVSAFMPSCQIGGGGSRGGRVARGGGGGTAVCGSSRGSPAAAASFVFCVDTKEKGGGRRSGHHR